MKVCTFAKDFKLTIPTGKELIVNRNKRYVFSDFVLKTFIDHVMEKGGHAAVQEMVKNVEELQHVFPVLNLADSIENLKKIHTLMIIRTGGIGDLLALSNVASLVTHIFKDILKVKNFRVFFITDSKYGAVFRYFDQMVTPIFYFYDSIDSVLKKHMVFGTEGVRSIFFEGVIEEREDNWFDLQMERLNINGFALRDQIDDDHLVKNPKLIDPFDGRHFTRPMIVKHNIEPIMKKFDKFEDDGISTILIHHRASAWIRSFNIGDAITTLGEYFRKKDIGNYRIITLPRNYTKSDSDFFTQLETNDPQLFSKIEQINTDNLHQFFHIICRATAVISSDTAAFHFREGIGAFALGIYSSFPSRMRTRTYVNTRSYDIIYPDCKFVCDQNNYIGCTSHFKTPYELCVHVAEKHKDDLTSDHHFKRGNRIPEAGFIKELEGLVKKVGIDNLMDEGVFQYAPCLSSRWNPLFKDQLLAIYEKENLAGEMFSL